MRIRIELLTTSGNRQLHASSLAVARPDRQVPAGQQGALAHARQSKPAVTRPGEAVAVVADPQQGAADERQLDVDTVSVGMLSDVGQALLRHAIDDELLFGAEPRDGSTRVE